MPVIPMLMGWFAPTAKRHRSGLGVAVMAAAIAIPCRAGSIPWRTASEMVRASAPDDIRRTLSTIATDPERRHVMVAFDAPVDAYSRAKLAGLGMSLLSPLGRGAYFATLDDTKLDAGALASATSIVGAESIVTRWKLHPTLIKGTPPPWSMVSGSDSTDDSELQVAVYVVFHRDVDLLTEAPAVLRQSGAVVRSELVTANGFVVELPVSAIATLAAYDAVQWIEPPLPAWGPFNDRNRELTQAELVQTEPAYGLAGSGVSVLVYDSGVGDFTHPDFGGRLMPRDLSDLSSHATHVAGIIGGSGFASGGRYRGMAPGTVIQSYGVELEFDPNVLPLYADPGDMEADYLDAITRYGASLANNSIGTNTCSNGFDCAINGDYGVVAGIIDGIVRGALARPLTVVWSAGNERNCDRCRLEGESTMEGYRSIAPPAGAKNAIVVGATNANDDSITVFTSWGPTDDGRVKPDLVAPGCEIGDDYGVTSLAVGGGYIAACGTSMAAPTVTGLAALLLQDFRAQFPNAPDPSNAMIKALFMHNAVDLVQRGPDYQSGYGSVRIKDTIDFMRTGRFLNGEVAQGEGRSILMEITPGDTVIKLTLAWDDAPAAPNVVNTLVNDLDLRLYDPDGRRHYPWTLDPARPARPAVRTRADHVNNVEQVVVEAPVPGIWRVQVYGYSVAEGPQAFSLCLSHDMAEDCDGNGMLDSQEINNDPTLDCSGNGILDACEPDCNLNGIADSCEIAVGAVADCDGDGAADDCADDCDGDGFPDECEILAGGDDCNANGMPDACEADCNGNLRSDSCDIRNGESEDCDGNGEPDECQNRTADCNGNGLWDACETASGAAHDFNHNAIPDDCENANIDLWVAADQCRQEGTGAIDDPFCTIQDAIDASISGQTVVVASGVYRGPRNRNLDFGGRTITLRSEDPADRSTVLSTVIDGEHLGRAFYFHSGETRSAVVDGMTVRNGVASQGGTPGAFRGGAVYCRDANPTFRRCIVTDNMVPPTIFAENGGGAFYLERSSALLDRCEVTGNVTSNPGGGVYCFDDSHAVIRSCLIAGNQSFVGGALALFESYPSLEHVTLADNRAESSGGAVHCNLAAPSLRNAVVWGNMADGLPNSFRCDNPAVAYSNVEGGWVGVDNIEDDPLFVSDIDGDYHLTAESPCANAGDPLFPMSDELDIDGEPRVSGGRTDMGADEIVDTDCNDNGINDEADISGGFSGDCNGNGLPDECEDCNENGVADSCDIDDGTSHDGNANGVPDECERRRTIHVDDDGTFDPAPGDPTLGDPNEDGSAVHPFDSIREAVAIAQSGDTVILSPGLYRGAENRDIDLGGRLITVRCTGTRPTDCVIDAQSVGRGFVFQTGESREARLLHLTITGGLAEFGGGVLCEGASPTIENCRIVDCVATTSGGGVYLRNAAPLIERCTISRNRALQLNGGGLYSLNSTPDVQHSVLRDNQAGFGGGGLFVTSRGEASLANCELAHNLATRGGALYVSASALHVESSTIADNFTTLNLGNSLYVVSSEGSLYNSIVWGHDDPSSPGELYVGTRAVLTVSYSNVRGGENGWEGSGLLHWLAGNVPFDPQFFDVRHGNYHLLPGSPCFNAGDSLSGIAVGNTDIDGNPRVIQGRIDIGADELETDCNRNGLLDRIELDDGSSADCNRNFVPDECEPDCDDNRTPDSCDIARGDDDDCNDNGVPDLCDLRSGVSKDVDGNGVLDVCEKCRDDAGCDDGRFCNGAEICIEGSCFTQESPCSEEKICREDNHTCVDCMRDDDCTDDNVCTNDVCVEGVCQFQVNDAACDDGIRCTLDDHCVAGSCVGSLAPNCGALFRLQAVAVNDIDLDGGPAQRITVAPGDRITCELMLENWQPQDLAVYQATVSAASLASGPRGQLDPLADPAPAAGAFIDQSRTDFVFAGITSITGVSLSQPDYAYAALGLLEDAVDRGVPAYCGTLILIASPDAAGLFHVGWRNGPAFTFLTDRATTSLLPLETQRLEVFVDTDCNENGTPDEEDILAGVSSDCTGNGLPDECEPDCDGNGIADSCDLMDGFHVDCDENDIPDVCEPDCNENGTTDACDIASDNSTDCDKNRVPDECDIRDHPERDCNGNGIPDKCDQDCNENGNPDDCDIRDGFSIDCDESGTPDECERDCNKSGVADLCDIANGTSDDQDDNGVPDECQRIRQVPADYETIQEAIDDAFDGDTVELDDGVYSGPGNRNIEFRGKAVTLRCRNGPGTCTIQPEALGRGLSIRAAEGPRTRIEGVVITTATTGVLVSNDASPTFVDCFFEGNVGTGVSLSHAGSPVFRRCRIRGNGGNGLVSNGSAAYVEDSLFTDNGGRGVYSRFDESFHLQNCTVSGNGIEPSFVAGTSIVRNSILHDERADGMSITLFSDTVLTVEYCNVRGGEAAVLVPEDAVLVWGEGNIDFPPGFADPDGIDDDPDSWIDNDYHLSSHSVCIDGGDPNEPDPTTRLDVDGEPRLRFDVIDIGADEADVFLDCNANGHLDAHDIVSDVSTDCNANGIPDECDIAGPLSHDCDGNGLPDECDVRIGFRAESPMLSPFGGTAPQAFVIPSPPPAYADIHGVVRATADIDGTSEFLDVRFNGERVARLFTNAGGACPAVPDEAVFVVPFEVYNDIVDGGDLQVDLLASMDVNKDHCREGSSIAIALEYDAITSGQDCNRDGTPDRCEPGVAPLVDSSPPSGAIDARQPHAMADAAQRSGWDTLELTYPCHILRPEASDFAIEILGAAGVPPEVEFATLIDGRTIRLDLSEPIPVGAWTVVTHKPTGQRLCIGALPGDVNGDRVSAVPDIGALIDSINGVQGHIRPVYATDIDRSGQVRAQDILRLIDLLNGAGSFESWIARTLPPSPCD